MKGTAVQQLGRPADFLSGCGFLSDDVLLSAGFGGVIHVWNPSLGVERLSFPALMQTEDAYSFAVRSDHRQVLVGGEFGSVITLDTSGRTFLRKAERAKRNIVWSVGYGDDDVPFAVADDQLLQLFPTGARPDPATVGSMPNWDLGVLALSGDRFVVGGMNEVRIVSGAGKVLSRLLVSGFEVGSAVSPRQDVLVTRGFASVSLWSLPDGEKLCTATDLSPSIARFSPDGQQIAVGTTSGRVTLLDTRCRPQGVLGGTRSFVRSAAVTKNRIILGDKDGRLSIWDQASFSRVSARQVNGGGIDAILDLENDGIISGGRDWRVFRSNDDQEATALGDAQASVNDIAYREQTKTLFWVDLSGRLYSRDETGPKVLYRTPGEIPLYSLTLDPHGAYALVGGKRGVARVPIGSNEAAAPWIDDVRLVNALVMSPDGKFVAVGTHDGGIVLRDAVTGAVVSTLREKGGEPHLAFYKEYLFDANQSGQLFRWKVPTGFRRRAEHVTEIAPESMSGEPFDGIVIDEETGRAVLVRADGVAEVRDAADGALQARLIQLQGEDWAMIGSDGQFVCTTAASHFLKATRAKDRKGWSLAALASGSAAKDLFVGTPGIERLGGGTVRIRVSVDSPAGAPTARFDQWPIRTIAPKKKSPTGYEIQFLFTERFAAQHILTVIGPDGAEQKVTLDLDADPTLPATDGRHHVLAIGLGNYEFSSLNDLPAAIEDANNLANAFRKPNTWALPAEESRALVDLKGDALRSAIESFLIKATPTDTLLLHLSGHGMTRQNESFLLPVDYNPSKPKRDLAASDLAGWLRASPAKQIVVIVDACHSGAFNKFSEIVSKVADDVRSRAILTSASMDKVAVETTSGGKFTGALIEALTDPRAVDKDVGAVTVGTAYARALLKTYTQAPTLRGTDTMGLLALAWPTPNGAESVQEEALGRTKSKGLELSYDMARARQVVLKNSTIDVQHDKLLVNAKFLADTSFLHIQIFEVGTSNPILDYFHHAQDKHGKTVMWRRWEELQVTIPLDSVMSGGAHNYRVEARPCRSEIRCDPPAKFSFRYPPKH